VAKQQCIDAGEYGARSGFLRCEVIADRFHVQVVAKDDAVVT
jgi:hypothetical protein